MSVAARLRIALLLACGVLPGLASPALAAPPTNDDYLQSIPVNTRGTELSDGLVLDAKDTREATVQTDLFAPPTTGGGVERTDCRGTRFGGTVWYDFHPHVHGVARVQATGFDAAVGVYEFDPASALIGTRRDCSNEPGANDELFVRVTRGKAYTIQIGGTDIGFGPALGNLQFTFEFIPDRDGDQVFDVLDKCPDQPGTAEGCPPELRVSAALNAETSARGIVVNSLRVEAPRGARVQVRCRIGCRFDQTRTALRTGTLTFTRLRGRSLPAGARLEIFVTKRESIGRYFRYAIRPGAVRRIERCLRPGSKTPRPCR